MKKSIIVALFLLTSCGEATEERANETGNSQAALDRAAIAAGILPDPDKAELAGAYERLSELGSDRFCAVPKETGEYRVGFYASYGPESHCTGRGTAVVDGNTVSLTLGRTGACKVEASFDGQILRFDGSMSERCPELCSKNAVLAGVSFPKASDDVDTALALTDRNGDKLCGVGRGEPAPKAPEG